MISDALITASGFFIFRYRNRTVFPARTFYSFFHDRHIYRKLFNLSKYFNVVCDNPEPICDYIVHTLGRSASVCLAKGAYSGNDKYIILTALNRMQAVHLRNFIRENDKRSFHPYLKHKRDHRKRLSQRINHKTRKKAFQNHKRLAKP